MAARVRRPSDDPAVPPEVLVAGIGNVLMRDDALGPHVVRVLAAGWEPPPDVALRDLGTPGADLISHLRGAGALVLVDTVRGEGPPGKLLRWDGEALARPAAGPRTGPHDPGLAETLSTLRLLGEAPADVVLLGVIPGEVRSGLGLTPAAARAVPFAAAAVRAELRRLGRPLRRRAEPRAPDLWWERAPGREPAPESAVEPDSLAAQRG